MNLVTGATGLLGSHLLLELINKGEKVRALKRKNASLKQVEHVFKLYSASQFLNNIEWVEGDIMDVYSIADALKNITHVYHCANVVSFDPKDEALMLKINIEGTSNVVNACLDAKIEKLCHVSSIAALNNSVAGQTISENIFWKSSPNNSAYAISKYGSEREAWRGIEEGLKVIIVNPSVILGASVFKTGSSSMLQRAKRGNAFYTNGKTGFVSATDVAKSMVLLMKSNFNNERYILSSENMSFKDFYTIANQQFGNKPPYMYCGKILTGILWRLSKIFSLTIGTRNFLTKYVARAAHSNRSFSNDKIRTAINFSFVPVKTTIEEACRDYSVA